MILLHDRRRILLSLFQPSACFSPSDTLASLANIDSQLPFITRLLSAGARTVTGERPEAGRA